MTPKQLKTLVDQTVARYSDIQHREYDTERDRYGLSHTEMWREASECAPYQWREIVRVLAQGGDYYSIEWPQTWLETVGG